MKRKDVDKLFSDIRNKVKEAEDDALSRVDKWIERMAFYRGYHYSVVDETFIIQEDDATGEENEKHNFIPSFVKAAVAARIRNFPNPQVPAANGTQEALQRASATEHLLKSFVDDEILSGPELIRALTIAAITGDAYLKFYWDPEAGRYTEEEPAVKETIKETEEGIVVEQEQITDPFGDPVISFSREGRIKAMAIDPFDAWPDPTATTMEECRYFVHRKMRPVDELKRMYPQDFFGREIKWSPGGYDQIYNTKKAIAQDDLIDAGREDMENGLAPLVEVWGAPNDDYPNGYYCLFSNHTLIKLGSCPYHPARIPFVFVPGDNQIPRSIHCDGTIEHLIPLQKTLNRAVSKTREWMDKILNPSLLVPYGSGINVKAIGEIPGQILEYNAGLRPEWLQVPPIAPSLFSVSASMFESMKIISGYSDITRGDMPSGGATGRAIAFLTENEENIRSADIKMYKKAVVDSMKHCLQLAKQFYNDGRMIRHLGNEAWQLFEFRSDDYDWYVDLAPEPFSGAPNSRALRWAETMEAFQLGLFNDEQPGAKEARRMLELDHGMRTTVDPESNHRNLALRENAQIIAMSKGANITMDEVREFHDDEIHLEEHNAFRNSPAYLELPQELRAQLDAHCDLHEQYLQNKMNQFAGNQQMLQGMPGAAPASPGMRSPLDGGNPVGEPASPSQAEFLTNERGEPIK